MGGAGVAGAPRVGRGCRGCGHGAFETILDLGRLPVADDVVRPDDPMPPAADLRLERCTACGLLQTPRDGPPPDLTRHGHGSAASPTLRAHLTGWAAELTPLVDAGSIVVDVAAHDDLLLVPFLACSATVVAGGRIPARPGLVPIAGLDPIGLAATVRSRFGPARLVIANHTLAHVDDLSATLGALAGLLADDGWLALETHDAMAIVDDDQIDVVSHAHRSYLTLAVLGPLLAAHGLTAVDARTLDAYGGTLRVLAARAGTPGGHPAPSVAERLQREREAGVADGSAFRDLADRTAARRGSLHAFLVAERTAGRSVAGYGAPGRAVTLLNWAGVDASLLPFTVDRAPWKQGGVIPGTGIPVRPLDALDADPPDTVVILAWTLRDEIAAQLAPLRARGVRLVVPHPTPALVA